MVEVYEIAGSDERYIAADEGLGITDFDEDAVYDDRFESFVDGFEVEDLVPGDSIIHMLEREGEDLKWGKTDADYLADALTEGPQR